MLDVERGETSLHYPGWRMVGLCFVMASLCWGLGFCGVCRRGDSLALHH